MFFFKKNHKRRKGFLIDTNFSHRKKGKKWRNHLLRFLDQFRGLSYVTKILKKSVLFTVIFLLMTGFILVALFSPYFEVKDIRFVRDNPLLDIEKLEEAVQPYYGKNLLFLSQKEIIDKLKAGFPEFREVIISEEWPATMEIQVKISPPFVNVLDEETVNFWVLSQDGVALEPGADETLSTLNILQYKKIIEKGQKILEKEVLEKTEKAEKFLQEELKINIEEKKIFTVSQELHLITDKGTAIWIDLALDIDSQVQKLRIADESIGLYSKDFEHIDLRIPQQIFYKEK